MRWCRLYNDEAENRRVRYVASAAGCSPVVVLGVLFAMKCHASAQRDDKRGTLAGWDDRLVAFDLGMEPALLTRIRHAMEGHYLDAQGLIDWHTMQYASDGSTERWRKWREKRSKENQEDTATPTLDQRLSNTAPTLDQRVRTEQSRTEKVDTGVSTKRARRAPVVVGVPDWMPPSEWAEWGAHRLRIGAKTWTPAAAKGCVQKLADYRDAGHDPAEVIRHSIASGYRGLYPPSDARPRTNARAWWMEDLINDRS